MASSSKTHAGTCILLKIPSSPSSHPPAPTISLFRLTPLVMGSRVEWKCRARAVGFKAFTHARCVVGWFSWHIVLLSSVFYLLFLLMAVFFHAVCQDKSLAEGLGFLVIDFFFFWKYFLTISYFKCIMFCVALLPPLSFVHPWRMPSLLCASCTPTFRSTMTEMLSASRVLHSSGSCSWLKSCLWVGAYGCCCLLHRQAFGSKGELFQSCRWLMWGAAIKVTTHW